MSRTTAILEALPYCVFAAVCAVALRHTVDDAYISFRYAENLAAGHGLVFNPGEYVEGYSNPLWVYAIALASSIGLPSVIASKALGICAAVFTLWSWNRLLERHFGVTPLVRRAALLFLAGHVSFVFYAVSGLETVLYTCLIVLLHLALLEKNYLLAAIATGLAAITRPEGVVLLAPLLLGLALAPDRRRALPHMLVALAIVGAQFAFRHAYYGKWWPNTFYAKASPTLDLVTLVTQHSLVFADGTGGWAHAHLAFGVLGVLGLIGLGWLWRVYPPMLLSVSLLFFFVWYSKWDWMAFDRFHVPILPLFLAYGFALISAAAKRWAFARQPLLLGALCLFLVGFSWDSTARELRQLAEGELFDPAMSGDRYLAAATYIRERSAPGDLVAAPEIGMIGYESKLRLLDLLGLVHDRIPALLGPVEYWDSLDGAALRPYVDYVFSHEPRFLILNFEAGYPDNLDPVMRSLHDRLVESGGYVLAKKFKLSSKRELAVFVADRERRGGVHARR